MNSKVTGFPQYRKLSNNKVYYRILDERHFDEIQIIGKSARLFNIEAKQYPEILRIYDLLEQSLEGIEFSTEAEFHQIGTNYGMEL